MLPSYHPPPNHRNLPRFLNPHNHPSSQHPSQKSKKSKKRGDFCLILVFFKSLISQTPSPLISDTLTPLRDPFGRYLFYSSVTSSRSLPRGQGTHFTQSYRATLWFGSASPHSLMAIAIHSFRSVPTHTSHQSCFINNISYTPFFTIIFFQIVLYDLFGYVIFFY